MIHSLVRNGAILVVVGSLFAFLVACTPLTTIPPTPTAIAIAIAPTFTLPPPRPTATASALTVTAGDILYAETFDSNQWGWIEREDGTRQLLDGIYRIDETKSPYGWLTQSNPRLLLDNSRAPHLDQPYEINVDVTLPPDLPLYALGIEANVQSLSVAGRVEAVAHTFTLRSNHTWIYAGGAGDATAALYRTGTLPRHLELRDGMPHRLTLQFLPQSETLHLTFLIDGERIATLDDLRAPTPDLEPLFQEVNGTIGITFGVTTDLISSILGDVSLRLTADFHTIEIRQLIIDN